MLGDEETRDRILRALGTTPKRSRRRGVRAGGALVFAAIGVAAFGLSLLGSRMGQPLAVAPGEIVVRIAREATVASEPLARRQRVASGRIVVAEGGRLEAAVHGATVSVEGPAEIGPRQDGIVLFSGSVVIDGDAVVEGSSCEASVSGRSRLTRFATHMHIAVERGTVDKGGDVSACDVDVVDAP